MTTRLGEQRALMLCWMSVLGSVLLAVIAEMLRDAWQSPMWLAGLIVVGLIALDVVLYHRRPRTGVMAAFPCVAASTAILALAWLASIYR